METGRRLQSSFKELKTMHPQKRLKDLKDTSMINSKPRHHSGRLIHFMCHIILVVTQNGSNP
jgi:hypothetical protein